LAHAKIQLFLNTFKNGQKAKGTFLPAASQLHDTGVKSFSAEEGLQNQMVFTSDNFSESI